MSDELTQNTRCRFGVARRDITAPVGIYARFWGAAKHDTADGVHRPATVTAAVMAPLDGTSGPTLALIAMDYGSFHPLSDEQSIRREVQRRTGFDESTLLLSLSHCHAGANASSRRALLPGGEMIADYLTFLTDQIAEAVSEASTSLEPCWITWGSGKCGMARNRDYWDASSGRWGVGYNAGEPADDTVLVGKVTTDTGEIRSVLFNYACHPTTLAWDNHLLSPDFVGAAREVIENAFNTTALFFQGASGELGPKQSHIGDTAIADSNGRQLGYAVAEAVEALPPPASKYTFTGIVSSGADIAEWTYQTVPEAELPNAQLLQAERITIPLRAKDIPGVDDLRAQFERTSERAEGERIQRRIIVREDLGEGDVYPMSVWIWRLGDAILVAIPNEPYSVLQTTLRAMFPAAPLMILGMTNGSLGYLCPADRYGSGRYQEKQSPFKPGCLEQTIAGVADGVTRLLFAASQA